MKKNQINVNLKWVIMAMMIVNTHYQTVEARDFYFFLSILLIASVIIESIIGDDGNEVATAIITFHYYFD